MKINMKNLEIISFILIVAGIFLFLYTIPLDKIDSNQLKIEATGAGRAREIGYGFKNILRPISYILLLLGLPLTGNAYIRDKAYKQRIKKSLKDNKISSTDG